MLYEKISEDLPEDSQLVHFWQPFTFKIDEHYQYVNNNFLFTCCSNLLYLIAYPILFLVNKICFGFKIEGRYRLSKCTGGKITISNHVHMLDCTMSALANFPNKTYFLSLSSNFQIPLVRFLIRLLNAIPIPNTFHNKQRFSSAIDTLLQNGKTLHIYPEGSLWPYYDKLRNFKPGAFDFAVHNQVPIVPFVYRFYSPKGLRKYIKRKPCVKLIILDPVYPDPTLKGKEAVLHLKQQVEKNMQKEMEN